MRISGEIVGILSDDHYNVKILTGFNKGSIIKYKYWKLDPLKQEENKKIVFV